MTDLNRREFLKSLGAVGAAAAMPGLINFAGMTKALAQDITDYKALVCINLRGGNDHGNTLVPYINDSLDYYKSVRGDVALTNKYSQQQLNATKLPKTTDQRQLHYSLHPELTFLKQAFDNGNLAVMQNTGVLKRPNTTRDLVKGPNASEYRPQNLFSHNDQQSTWQTGDIESARQPGWASYIAEQFDAGNTSSVFKSVSVDKKTNLFAGANAGQYVLSKNGLKRFYSVGAGEKFGLSEQVPELIVKMMQTNHDNIFEDYIAKQFVSAFDAHTSLNDILNTNIEDESSVVNISFSSADGLAQKLKVIAHLIQIREQLGLKRQMFMVNQTGHDVHSGALNDHSDLMKDLNQGLSQFYAALEGMNLTQQVTTFTFSEFGRSFASNGSGSDHGWGGHHFVLGGSVKGGHIYGTTPDYTIGSQDDFNQGRLIPSTSHEQYIATLAQWFGVENSKLSQVAPNLIKFAPSNLGFMV